MVELVQVALGIANALHEMHARGLVHEDIRPSNMLADFARGTVRLGGFGHTARIASSEPPPELNGSFHYVAPEQTGRQKPARRSAQRSLLGWRIDLRAAHWAIAVLGVVAQRVDPQPCRAPRTNPGGQRADPASRDRVQAAREEPRGPLPNGWRARARPRALPERSPQLWRDPDASARRPRPSSPTADLRSSLRSYPIVAAFLEAFQRVAKGAAELVTVSGYSGIGKTSLVSQLMQSLAARSAQLARGKFDQYKRDIPYATLAEALRELVLTILREPAAAVAHWRVTLQDALGDNGALITSLVPELELLVGAAGDGSGGLVGKRRGIAFSCSCNASWVRSRVPSTRS